MKWLSERWKKWSDEGVRWPFLHDPTTGKPSITLFFPYATFALAFFSAIALHFKSSLMVATWTCIGFWVIATVLYMMRKITRAKFDLDDKEIDIDAVDIDSYLNGQPVNFIKMDIIIL
jgi:hypothetical protein